MGDNIYLGDRDGVRTPMQWSADRNGGFSRADTQRLYLPPIMDPVYGYAGGERRGAGAQPVVAAALDAPADRRAAGAPRVRPRQRSPCLHPDNRHIAAYVARAGGRGACCASRTWRARPQAVSLDLSRYTGRTPVEMTRLERVSADRRRPLRAHAARATRFFWFVLAAPRPRRRYRRRTRRATPQLPEFVTVVLPRGRASLLDDAGAHDARARRACRRSLAANRLSPRAQAAGAARACAISCRSAPSDDAPALAILGVAAPTRR